MPQNIPINNEKSSDVVLAALLRLKIRDAMAKNVVAATSLDSLRHIQTVMKEQAVSAVPILEGERLVGMISVNDIMSALDKGYIEQEAKYHMATSLIVLEDDMPLSFAIAYLNKYSYRRYPVINKKRQLVGIISSRDVLIALINELNKEITDLERKIMPEKTELPTRGRKEFIIKKYDFENAGHASFEFKKFLQEKDIPKQIIRRASIASYELEINIVIHSEGGKISFSVDHDKIIIIAQDKGPGITDTELVMKEGYSTANEWIRQLGFGAGMGIPNTKRVSDEFKLESSLGGHTLVTSVIYLEGDNEHK
jgi:CBS domain-containing protein/anti-sigma regulatory factor (Ser/Thr protein kinase)